MLESCLWIFSSAFNTIIPSLLQNKLIQLGVPDSTCRWITDFLSDRKQHVRLGKHLSESRTISTGSPQGCVLSPLLFSLYSNSCTSSHQSVKLLKFADDTTIIGLISGGDESAYRWEIDHMAAWCTQNNLELNAVKTVEMIADFRKNRYSEKVIGLQSAFSSRTTCMVHFYTSIIESILTSSISIWYAAATAKDKGRLQRINSEKVWLQSAFSPDPSQACRKDCGHPGHKLFETLPSGRRLRSIRTKTSRHKNSFFPSAVSLINKAQ